MAKRIEGLQNGAELLNAAIGALTQFAALYAGTAVVPAQAHQTQSVTGGKQAQTARVQAPRSTARATATQTAPDGLSMRYEGGERIKLPKALFSEYSAIVLIMPNGAELGLAEDSEGRARLNVAQTRELGVQVGQYLVFTETEAGYFQVSITGKAGDVGTGHRRGNGAQAQAASVTDDFAAMFADVTFTRERATVAPVKVPDMEWRARNAQKAETPKRERTQAQKDATARMLAARQAKLNAGAQAQTQTRGTSPVVPAGQPIRPVYVAPVTVPVLPVNRRNAPTSATIAARRAKDWRAEEQAQKDAGRIPYAVPSPARK